MELYLQFGYGMMEHSRQLISDWNGGTVVLSPRDLTADQLIRLSNDIRMLSGGSVLLDPQFYLPHADHERLCNHDYWPRDYQTGNFWHGQGLSQLLANLWSLNAVLGTRAFILPGLLASKINFDWLNIQQAILAGAANFSRLREQIPNLPELPIYSTIALSAEAVQDTEAISEVIDAASSWKADGYYVVCEHPNGSYLTEDANWLANILDLAAGLRLTGAKVIIGYSNHQILLAACTNATAICSGTWMNVRSFPPDKFRSSFDEEIKQRTTWYYCPQALSEYKLPFLDLARRQSVLEKLRPSPNFDDGYAAPLFAGAQPSSVGFTEQAAFRHYLTNLRRQCQLATRPSFEEAVQVQEDSLNSAEELLGQLSAKGIRGQLRDFAEIVDVNRAALALLSTTRGAMLRRAW